MNIDLKKLADKLGYTLIEGSTNVRPNNCALAYPNVYVGEYKNEEYLMISFFHEHGHTLVPQSFKKRVLYNTLLIELEAWNLGLKAAAKMGYHFSDAAIAWAYREKALSYVGHDEREWGGWSKKIKPLLWKNRPTIDVFGDPKTWTKREAKSPRRDLVVLILKPGPYYAHLGLVEGTRMWWNHTFDDWRSYQIRMRVVIGKRVIYLDWDKGVGSDTGTGKPRKRNFEWEGLDFLQEGGL